MRIISGIHKGRRLIAPKKLPVRPTTDMAKESLFNILRNRYQFSTLRVLDLFSGTGNLSYEFASRGVQHITAVDAHSGCIQYINKTATELEMPIETFKSDVYAFLNRESNSYDIIVADPPYDFEDSRFIEIVNLVFDNNLLKPEGSLILEHSKHTDLHNIHNFNELRKYGGSAFSFFKNPDTSNDI
ncbi:MAG: 16S rRNA (guanine(966)-N(2))-methyltransferase RsmD [Sphingobium sp.]|nr:MAG: 16S rRNA (guanine(966)-N(2))-methyltransferase RsmD [Sphingobium sp.]